MFPLPRTTLPVSASDLADAIESALREVIEHPSPFVTVTAPEFPAISALSVDLSGARIAEIPPRPPSLSGIEESAYVVEKWHVGGSNIDLLGASTDLALDAEDLELSAARDTAGNIVLVLKSASSGQLRLGMAKTGLEALLQTIGRKEAAKHGVNLESVNIDWTSRGARSVDAFVTVRARKFFMSAAVKISGSLDVDEYLTVRLSALRCSGDGALAGIACNALTPQLEKLNGREFSLRALPIGELAIRDLEIAATDRLEIRAKFGAAA